MSVEERRRDIDDDGSGASPQRRRGSSGFAAGDVLTTGNDGGRGVRGAAATSHIDAGRPERNDQHQDVSGMKPAAPPPAAGWSITTHHRAAVATAADLGKRPVAASRAYQFRKAKSAATFLLDGVSYTIGK